jgi:methylmalonyl-CoA/ethylmalonyl-CoA epimerase
LRAQGCCPAGAPQPAVAYGGRRVQFFVSPLRFVIELIEKPDHMHTFEDLRSAEML